MADQMPTNCVAGFWLPGQVFRFLPELLWTTLAKVAAAGCNKLACFVDADVFCYRDERDFTRTASGGLGRCCDPLLNAAEIVGGRAHPLILHARVMASSNHSASWNRFDFHPFPELATRYESAGAELAGNVLTKDGSIADRTKRAVNEPLIVARLRPIADCRVGRYDLQIFADG